jgi:hypothetical protein
MTSYDLASSLCPALGTGPRCLVTVFPTGATAGSSITLTVEARDAFGNGVPPVVGEGAAPFVASAVMQLPDVGAVLAIGTTVKGSVAGPYNHSLFIDLHSSGCETTHEAVIPCRGSE